MANCKNKKCGKELKKTSKILSVTPDSEAEKKGLKGKETIVSIDNTKVDFRDDIETAIKNKRKSSILVKRQHINKIDDFEIFLNNVEFSDGKTEITGVKSETQLSDNGISVNESIVSVDGKIVKNRQEIEKIIKEKKSCLISGNKQLKVDDFENILSGIEIEESRNGLIIKSIKKESDAAKVGFAEGDSISSIDGINVKNKRDFEKVFDEKKVCYIVGNKNICIDDIETVIKDLEIADNDTEVIINKIKADSEIAKKSFSNGDIIVAIDDKNVKNKQEIENIVRERKSCKIKTEYKGDTTTVELNDSDMLLKDVEFSDESVCSYCGAKQKNKLLPIVIGVGSVLIAAGVIVAIVPKNRKNKDEIEPLVNSVKDNGVSIEDNGKLEETEPEILPVSVIEELESALASDNTTEGRTRSASIRTEVTYATDENGNLLDLRDTLIDGTNLKDGVTINITERNASGSAETKTRTRRASTRTSIDTNDSLASTLNNVSEIKDTVIAKTNISDITEKLTGKVPFKYGSYLDMGEMSVEVEKYLLVQKLDEDKKEYASIILGLNDLIKKIPEDKKDSAVFIVMGYADTTLFNGIPEVSERSEKFNTELSWKRAESVKSILTGKDFGISPEKVVTHGFGYSKNVNETTDLERFRRVDIVVSFK